MTHCNDDENNNEEDHEALQRQYKWNRRCSMNDSTTIAMEAVVREEPAQGREQRKLQCSMVHLNDDNDGNGGIQ